MAMDLFYDNDDRVALFTPNKYSSFLNISECKE